MTRKSFLRTAGPLVAASAGRMSGQKANRDSLASVVDSPERVLGRIRNRIETLLRKPQPALYVRHLRSVMALCDEEILRLQFAGTGRTGQTTELLGYLKAIEAGLNDDGGRAETYLLSGRRALNLVRVSRSDGTLQFYAVSLPPRWDATRAYPLWVELHGRGPDLPLGAISNTFLPYKEDQSPNDEAVTLRPWLRGMVLGVRTTDRNPTSGRRSMMSEFRKA